MKKSYNGSCMCGAVQFSFSDKPRFVKDCVCDACRRAHGSTAVCWVGVATAQFSIDKGESHISWYASSTESERGFCSSCGTRFLFRSSKWPDEMHMSLACITTPHDLVSSGVGFTDEFPKWTAMAIK